MVATKEMVVREKEKLERAKDERKQELEEHMTSRKEQLINEKLVADVSAYEQEQIEQEQYQRFLETE